MIVHYDFICVSVHCQAIQNTLRMWEELKIWGLYFCFDPEGILRTSEESLVVSLCNSAVPFDARSNFLIVSIRC